MSRKKNKNQDDNLTARLMIRLSNKDMRNFENLAEKECLDRSNLARRIILLYLRQELSN